MREQERAASRSSDSRWTCAALCRDAADELGPALAGQVQFHFEGDLSGHWDRDRLFQVLSNLLTNALRYGEGVVGIEGHRVGHAIELSIHNGGAPISPELLPIVFHAFERGAQDRVGLGLGLFIVREIVKSHGGDVSVASSAEAGTTFTIRLPVMGLSQDRGNRPHDESGASRGARCENRNRSVRPVADGEDISASHLVVEMAGKRANRDEWRKRVDRWKDSGLTANEFVAETGINAGTLQFWGYKLKSRISKSGVS